jgi:large subunit ribosomal protein L22
MARGRKLDKVLLGEEVASARVRFTQVPPRKARSVADLIRGLSVGEARRQLQVLHRPSAVPMISRLLKSAVANANQNEDLKINADDLVIGQLTVDGGPTLKRWRPRAMGRACIIRKRMSHMTLKLYAQV